MEASPNFFLSIKLLFHVPPGNSWLTKKYQYGKLDSITAVDVVNLATKQLLNSLEVASWDCLDQFAKSACLPRKTSATSKYCLSRSVLINLCYRCMIVFAWSDLWHMQLNSHELERKWKILQAKLHVLLNMNKLAETNHSLRKIDYDIRQMLRASQTSNKTVTSAKYVTFQASQLKECTLLCKERYLALKSAKLINSGSSCQVYAVPTFLINKIETKDDNRCEKKVLSVTDTALKIVTRAEYEWSDIEYRLRDKENLVDCFEIMSNRRHDFDKFRTAFRQDPEFMQWIFEIEALHQLKSCKRVITVFGIYISIDQKTGTPFIFILMER